MISFKKSLLKLGSTVWPFITKFRKANLWMLLLSTKKISSDNFSGKLYKEHTERGSSWKRNTSNLEKKKQDQKKEAFSTKRARPNSIKYSILSWLGSHSTAAWAFAILSHSLKRQWKRWTTNNNFEENAAIFPVLPSINRSIVMCSKKAQ